MLTAKSAKLVLRTFDLPVSGTTTLAGYTSNFKSVATWTNVNLIDLMGSMYDEYEQFNLVLTTMTSGYAPACGSTNEDRVCSINLSGLSWANQGYKPATKQTAGDTNVGNIFYSQNNGLVWYPNFTPCVSTFNKGSNVVNLTITINRGLDGLIAASIVDWNITYTFNIYGVESTRIKK